MWTYVDTLITIAGFACMLTFLIKRQLRNPYKHPWYYRHPLFVPPTNFLKEDVYGVGFMICMFTLAARGPDTDSEASYGLAWMGVVFGVIIVLQRFFNLVEKMFLWLLKKIVGKPKK